MSLILAPLVILALFTAVLASNATDASDGMGRMDKIKGMYAWEGFVYSIEVSDYLSLISWGWRDLTWSRLVNLPLRCSRTFLQ
jgi:hypothetical protein